ncbi:MAG: alkane 1-monooxygenase [Cyclobacteriaceae bacterium]|nr:alkane 1-monooxygenase [Cyclobacteriaceae bacterium]
MGALKKLGFFAAFIIPALTLTGYYLDGWWNYLAIAFSFVIIPLIDSRSGINKSNIESDRQKIIGEEFYYRFVTYVWTYIQLAFVIWACGVIGTGNINTAWEWIGFTVSTALVTGGIGITVAHELGHKKSSFERFYSKVLLMTVCYMHFYIEHNRGHHVLVATPADPATARKNESFYAFWVRSVFQGYGHAWQLEAESLGKKNLPALHWRNNMIWFAIFPVLFCGALTVVFSILHGLILWQIPVFFFSQSILAFTLLEMVNYVEHYGITRKELSPGRYERVNPVHSWNASHLVSNFFLFQLQRHSDHHVNAIKRYQVLNHYDESPQLPFGYPTMIIIATLPPLWFSMMNRRLEEWSSKTVNPSAQA